MDSQEEARYGESSATGATKYRDSLIWFMLFILAERPMHGYEIIKKIKELTMNQWKPAAGSIYPLLNYMKEAGLIEVVNVEEGVRGGRKIVYRLTDKGWSEFRSLLMRKSTMYMNLLSQIVQSSIKALRDHGFEADAKQLCESVSRWMEEVAKALPLTCMSNAEENK